MSLHLLLYKETTFSILSIKHFILTVIFSLILSESFCQDQIHLTFNQPSKLEVDAGNDTSIKSGESVFLGGDDVATGGSGDYSFFWSSNIVIANPGLPNPLITPDATSSFYLYVTDGNGCSAYDSISVQVVPVVEMQHIITEDEQISFWPNPISQELNIKLPNNIGIKSVTIRISNLSGDIYECNIYNVQSGVDFIVNYDIGHFPPGYYLVNINGERINKSFKILKN